jgi:hypothetical protein
MTVNGGAIFRRYLLTSVVWQFDFRKNRGSLYAVQDQLKLEATLQREIIHG